MSLNYLKLFDDHTCKLCEKYCKNRRSLGNHLARSHNGYDIQSYVLQFYLNGINPKCKCGCGEDVKWKKTKYCFGEYVNGHNNRFTANKQPTFTKEQVKDRNVAIRRAYKENSKSIKAKISKSLEAAWQDNEKRERWELKRKTQYVDNGWTTESISKLRKKVWRENYDEMYKKIFTDEFKKKISLANMSRNLTNTSKKEQAFIKVLTAASKNDKVVDSYWVNSAEYTKCFDAFIPSHNLLIEFDGVFWHGLDRSENFTVSQLSGMTNDLKKNEIAKLEEKSLIRINSTCNWKNATTIQELIDLAYYHQDISGSIIKDERQKFDDKTRFLTRSKLIEQNHVELGGKGKEWTENVYLPAIREFMRAFVSANDWFYPKSRKSLRETLVSVRKIGLRDCHKEPISSLGVVGNAYLKEHIKSFWHVSDGPVASFMDDKSFNAVLRYRLGINNSKKYEYQLDNGEMFSTNEHFDISFSTIRRGFIVQRKAVSFFKPTAAAVIYQRFLGHLEKPSVWDPSGGFGARMLGFAAMFPEGSYTCTEPGVSLSHELTALGNKLKKGKFINQVSVIKSGSECVKFDEYNSFDLVFTSPPYFDLEKYFDEPGQCWRDYPNIDAWKDLYLVPTLTRAKNHLAHNGRVVINISRALEKDVIESAKSAGLELVETFYLSAGRDHFSRKKSVSKPLTEPILVFIPRR